jgi:hypothetical protein
MPAAKFVTISFDSCLFAAITALGINRFLLQTASLIEILIFKVKSELWVLESAAIVMLQNIIESLTPIREKSLCFPYR